jgi:hypothetical protein
MSLNWRSLVGASVLAGRTREIRALTVGTGESLGSMARRYWPPRQLH